MTHEQGNTQPPALQPDAKGSCYDPAGYPPVKTQPDAAPVDKNWKKVYDWFVKNCSEPNPETGEAFSADAREAVEALCALLPASPLPADDVIDRSALLKKLTSERDEYFSENFVIDPETGAGEASRAKEEYLQYLEETIEEIENFPAANLLRQSAPVDDGTVTITRARYEKYQKAEIELEHLRQPVAGNASDLVKALEDRSDDYEEALEKIVQWAEAYPLNVFPEPDFKKAAELLKAGGITLDAVSASCMRHVVEGVGKIAESALTRHRQGEK